jgi:hypothetical protein
VENSFSIHPLEHQSEMNSSTLLNIKEDVAKRVGRLEKINAKALNTMTSIATQYSKKVLSLPPSRLPP